MKAISLWQPWASAIALGIKSFETRSWSTSYRGPLVIHAAERWSTDQRRFAEVEIAMGRLPANLPLGCLIAVVDIVTVYATEEAGPMISAIERLYGDYSPGRFAWQLANVRPLAEPIPWRGALGLFEVPDVILTRALKEA
jgi:hypothetical protein